MRIKVYYEGNVFVGNRSDMDITESAEELFYFIKNSNSIKLPLENGSYFIAGREVIQKAVFILEE